MSDYVQLFGALAVVYGLLYLVTRKPAWLASLWWRIFPAGTWYPPEAPDPVDEHFNAARGFYVPSNHPTDCTDKCCFEIRLNEMVERFDWHAAEYEMRKTK